MRKKKERKMEIARMKKQVIFNIAVIALLVLLFNFSISISPQEGMQTRNTALSFRWMGITSYAIVDDNPDFTSPIIVEKDKEVELEPGKYYWCVPIFNNCVKKSTFEIESEVSLVSKEIETGEENASYLIENTGNTAERIEIKNLLGRMLTGFFILEPHATNVVELNETARIIATEG